jgi:hypothetical protein
MNTEHAVKRVAARVGKAVVAKHLWGDEDHAAVDSRSIPTNLILL